MNSQEEEENSVGTEGGAYLETPNFHTKSSSSSSSNQRRASEVFLEASSPPLVDILAADAPFAKDPLEAATTDPLALGLAPFWWGTNSRSVASPIPEPVRSRRHDPRTAAAGLKAIAAALRLVVALQR